MTKSAQPLKEFNLRAALQNGLTFGDNCLAAWVEIPDCVHGVEKVWKNSLPRGTKPIAFWPRKAVDADGVLLQLLGDPPFNDSPDRGASYFGITPRYFENIGERIGSIVLRASAVVIATATAVDVTSITLTPGSWDITGIVGFKGLTTSTMTYAHILTTSAAAPSTTYEGDNAFELPVVTANDSSIAIPSYRVALTATTTYYLTAYAAFTASASPGAYGRLSAVRAAIDPATSATITGLLVGG